MSKPTVILVHGAFGDASSWRSVFEHLDRDEYDVLAAAVPLRGVASDVSYLGAVIDQLDEPVVLVGHSYSGCVITAAGALTRSPGWCMSPDSCPTRASRSPICRRATRRSRWATSSSRGRCSLGVSSCRSTHSASTTSSAPTARRRGGVHGDAQRPLLARAFEEPATAAAWRTKPSWAVFGTGDEPIAPQLHRFSYERAGSKVTEVEGASHFVMLSKPDVVAGVIREAVMACAANPV